MAIPFVMIDLDKPRKLRFGMKSMVEFERTNKIKLLDIGENMSVEICAKLAYTMLKQEDPELTLEKTIELLDEHMLAGDAIEKINEAIAAAFPNSKNAGVPAEE